MQLLNISENGIVLQFGITEGRIGLYNFGRDLSYSPADNEKRGWREYAFNQVHIAGGSREAHRGGKLVCASETSQAKYISHRDSRSAGGRLLEIVTASERVEITTRFMFYDGTGCVRVNNIVRNISDAPVCLEEVNSFFLYAIGGGGRIAPIDKLNIYLPTNSWHIEAQWKKYSYREKGLENGNTKTSFKRLCVTNTGSWSTKEYLPMGLIEDTETNGFLLWQIENNGSWHYETGDMAGGIYLNIGGPNFVENFWAKNLAPGETFEGVPCSLTVGGSINEVFSNITKYRRRIRRPNSDDIDIPVVFNSYMHAMWDYPAEKELKPLIDAASEVGCDYFCIDAGWFDEEKDWWHVIGNWEESRSRFPEGLQKTINYIKSKNMKAGLWLEIEGMGKDSSYLNKLPDECYFARNGNILLERGRRQLDFSHPLVIKRADEVVDGMLKYGIEYIKMDYNLDCGPGTSVNSDSLGDGLLMHNRAYIKWIEKVLERYPGLVVENCGSGGCRMDYAMLAVHSIQSTSDQTDYKKYAYIAANSVTAVTPEQSAVWSYPLADRVDPKTLTDETVIFNMVNSLLGRIHLASFIDRLSQEHRALIKQAIEYYNSMKTEKIGSLPYMPFGFTQFGAPLVASGIRGIQTLYLAVWNTGGNLRAEIPLYGLDIESVRVGYPGDRPLEYFLTNNILSVVFTEAYQARLFEVRLKK